MPLILPGNVGSATGGAFEVANSCRLQGTGDYFYRTNSSATNTYTFSAWIKKADPISDGNEWFFASDESGFMIRDTDGTGGDQFHFYNNSNSTNYYSGAVRRDVASWYNVIFSSNSGTGTIYVNGVVDKDSITVPNLGTGNNGFVVGKHPSANSQFFGGYMAEVVFIDGTALDHTSFGEVDGDSGIWKPIDVSGLTFGTNGFYLDFEDSSDLGNDVSGNNNNLTHNGNALDQSIDTCTNNFATLNPLNYSSASKTYAEGNTAITASASNTWCSTFSTFAVNSGKWYTEYKITDVGSYSAIGVGYQPFNTNTSAYAGGTILVGEDTGSAGWRNNGAAVHSYSGSSLSSWTTNDILQIAIDMDNQKLYFGKNGTYENSGNPASGASGTGSVKDLTAGEDYLFVICPRGGGTSVNFGAPSHSISSGNTDANGIGNFEYSVPSGYFSLCTKNLAENS